MSTFFAPTYSRETDYAAFLSAKSQVTTRAGFSPLWIPDWLFDFQKALVEWSILTGRSAILADCGLGKGPMELVWGENVVRHTRGNVILAAPLAVSHQIIREADKFGIRATRSIDGTAYPGITVTNYERLHLFRPSDFVGFIGDESSILKAFDGVRKAEITAFMRKMAFRLLSTATPAPNDYIELGTSSEALGYLGYVDMLNRFFTNKQRNTATGRNRGEKADWRFKGHAEQMFWRWVVSWARAIRKPSDLGYLDGAFVLPPLVEQQHIVEARRLREGCLFELPAVGQQEQREDRRRTIEERCERVAELVNGTGEPALVWCNLNPEGDLLQKLIPDAVQVSGSDSDDLKEARLIDFAAGNARVLITKPKIAGWGMNFQHCAHITEFPTDSYEAYYQGVRRCWRFGQTREVRVDSIVTEGDARVVENRRRKAEEADRMFTALVSEMHSALDIARSTPYTKAEVLPTWLS